MAIHRTASPKYRPSGLRTSQIRGFSSTPTVRVFPRPSTATPFGLAKKLHLPKHDVLKYKKPKKHTNPPPKKSITVKIPMALDPEELRLAERTNLGLSVQALTELSISPVTISANLRGGKGPPLDDYTGRVTIKDPVDTSHRLLDLYDGEVTGAGGPSKVMVNVLKVIGDGPGDHSFDKWTAAVYERLKSEIGAWKKINGPFVHYIGFARVDDVPAVLTQAVEGTRAKDFLESASVQDRRSLIVGFAKALEALHAEQLPHGNLEPQHFVVDTKGKAKLSGFCFNHMIERELSKVKPVGEHHRSARYAAPEALEDKTVADKLDVYSFACVALGRVTKMSERINVLYRRIDERSKQATVLPAVQARIANRAVHLSKLLIQQLQVVDDEGIGSVPEGLGDELDSFIKALQDVEDVMIATEQSGFLTRLLSAMWVNARLATAQEGLESSYKQLVTAIRTSAQSTAGPVDLPPYSLVGKTPSAPTDVLDSARPKWSDVELLASLTTRRPSDQSSSWASVFTAKVAGVRGTVMVKTYPGKRRDALALLLK
ncbi:hypothetical protein FRC05_007090 [Tulasnella sp. 425]|nr:hypothetical protein FRC05_007090 [Tulasnella sp. 425]